MQIVGLSPGKACMERTQHCASVLRISSSSADSDRNIISKIFRPSLVLTDQNIVSKNPNSLVPLQSPMSVEY